jgi:protein required for attachment to host cells
MSKTTTWLLVADASGARVFAADPAAGTLVREPVMTFEGDTAQSREIASDRPGRTFDRAGEGRHAKEPPTDPQRYEKERFAKHLVDALEKALATAAFDRLAVVAPPQMLGDLRAAYGDGLQKAIVKETAKDLAMQPAHELERMVGDLVA